MYQYQDQKEMRRALNGKMIVMLVNGRNGGQGE